MIQGHNWVLQRYGKTTLRAFMFVGIPSIGKWTTAEALKKIWKVSDSDVLRIYKMTAVEAREAVQFASMAPTAGPTRLVIIRLTRSVHQNILLKALEEAPETTKFILIPWAADDVLPAVASRCIRVLFQPLKPEEVSEVLKSKGIPPSQADVWSQRSEGQVKRGFAFREINEAKPLVGSVLRAFRDKDPLGLDKAADGWTEAHTDLLVTWCHESITQRWSVFSDEESGIPGRLLPMKILVALRTEARPKLVVRSVLADLLRSVS